MWNFSWDAVKDSEWEEDRRKGGCGYVKNRKEVGNRKWILNGFPQGLESDSLRIISYATFI